MSRDALAGLRADIATFKSVRPRDIEDKVKAAGFRCRGCAKCCRGRYGDNTVTIFPSEIRAVMAATGFEWLDVARPHESGDVDGYGFIHTFEWALRRKPDGDCAFLDGGRCTIYEHRPLICRTYPMRLEGRELELYECDGLGSGAPDGAGEMAEALVGRQVAEAEESAALLEKYGAFRPSGAAHGRVYVVHDSEGFRLVGERGDGSFAFL